MLNIDRKGMISDLSVMQERADVAIIARRQELPWKEIRVFQECCESFKEDLSVSLRCGDLLELGLACTTGHGSYRCGKCRRMQSSSSIQVWMPEYMEEDGLTRYLLKREIELSLEHIGWCESCAHKLIANLDN